MSFKKLDKALEQSVMSAIEQIIDKTRFTPDADLNKVAAETFTQFDGMTPELVRRACEAYNKSKSIHTLQKRASEDRAEDIPLIDPSIVINLIYGYHKKAASAALDLPIPALQENTLKVHGLSKVAFDLGAEPQPVDVRCLDRQIMTATDNLSRSIDKFREKISMHKQASEDAIHRICSVIRRMPSKPMMKVARLAVNRYGDDGVRLMKLVGAHTSTEFKLNKTAAAAIFPLEEPYTSVSIAIDEARSYNHFNRLLKKVALTMPDLGVKEQFQEEAGEGVRGMTSLSNVGGAARGVGSAIKGSAQRLLDPVINFAKTPMYEQLTKEKKVGEEEAFDATLRNRLNQIRATQAFVDVASDDFTKDYPIDETMEAYNNVVGAMPDLLDPKYSSWLKSLVRQQLVQGNVSDPATIKELQAIGKEIAKGRITDVDMAAKQLEDRAAKYKAGLDAGRVGDILDGSRDQKAPQRDKGGEKKAPRRDAKADELKERELAVKEREMDLKEKGAERRTQSEKDVKAARSKTKKVGRKAITAIKKLREGGNMTDEEYKHLLEYMVSGGTK